MLPAKQQHTPARYVGQAVYDGKRQLTPKQLAHAQETARRSKDIQALCETVAQVKFA